MFRLYFHDQQIKGNDLDLNHIIIAICFIICNVKNPPSFFPFNLKDPQKFIKINYYSKSRYTKKMLMPVVATFISN